MTNQDITRKEFILALEISLRRNREVSVIAMFLT